MSSSASVFLDFNLPNATTWFYFSLLLAIALFFKFSRILSWRNLDILLMFLLAPGLLLVLASRPQPGPPDKDPRVQVALLIGDGALADSPARLAGQIAAMSQECGPALENVRWMWFGYLWLLVGSGIFFCRCLLDLALAQRPALPPNLQAGGLAWLAGALLICLLAVAFRQVERQANPVAKSGVAAPAVGPVLHPDNQVVIAAAVSWRDWPAWGVAALAFGGHVVVVVLLVLICWRHFQDPASGMAAATFYLMLPYTGAYVGQVQHVLPMALFLGAVLAFRSPAWAGAILGIATGITYFPVFVLPIWLSFYRGRGSGRFLIAFVLSSAMCLAALAAMLDVQHELEPSIGLARHSAAWVPWKVPDTEGFWTGVHFAYRIPVFLLFLSFVLATMFWPSPKNLAHVIALSAAVFVGLQLWGADQGGLYALWYLPLVLLLVFRPNLQDRVPGAIDADTDWLIRSRRAVVRFVRRLLRRSEPTKVEPADVSKNGQNMH